jgi:hypothetical protein
MTSSVKGTVTVGGDGWVIGYLTNNSDQTLYVAYTFKKSGVPSTTMSNAGATTIQGGQTVGGKARVSTQLVPTRTLPRFIVTRSRNDNLTNMDAYTNGERCPKSYRDK